MSVLRAVRPRILLVVLSVLLVTMSLAGVRAPAHADGPGVIEGVVTGADGQPLAGVTVVFERALPDCDWGDVCWDYPSSTVTDASGRYSFETWAATPCPDTDIAPASCYRVSFWPDDGLHAMEWWENHRYGQFVPDLVPISAGQVTDVSPQLELGGQVSGQVSDATDTPLAGVVVKAWQASPEGELLVTRSTTTGADGRYRLTGIDRTSAYIGFQAEGYATTFYPGVPGPETATELMLETDAESVRTGIDVRLYRAAALAGVVTDAAGAPVAGAAVTLDGPIPVTHTDELGRFRFTGLPPDSYRLQVFPSGYSELQSEYYDDATFVEEATTIVLGPGQDRTDVDVVLDRWGTISGDVTAPYGSLEGALVRVIRRVPGGDWMPGGFTTVDAEGHFEITRVAKGPWVVEVTPSPANPATPRTYWPGTTVRGEATPVVLGAGQHAVADLAMAFQPVSTFPPSIIGIVKVGRTVRADPGSWEPQDAPVAFQWYADGSAVPGATEAAFTVGVAQYREKISVRTTAYPGTDYAVTSSPSPQATVSAGAIRQVVAPAVKGAPRVGRTLRASPGVWEPADVRVRYQWFAGTTKVAGATSSALRLTRALVGQKVSVRLQVSTYAYMPETRRVVAGVVRR